MVKAHLLTIREGKAAHQKPQALSPEPDPSDPKPDPNTLYLRLLSRPLTLVHIFIPCTDGSETSLRPPPPPLPRLGEPVRTHWSCRRRRGRRRLSGQRVTEDWIEKEWWFLVQLLIEDMFVVSDTPGNLLKIRGEPTARRGIKMRCEAYSLPMSALSRGLFLWERLGGRCEFGVSFRLVETLSLRLRKRLVLEPLGITGLGPQTQGHTKAETTPVKKQITNPRRHLGFRV